MRLKDSVGGSALLTSGAARQASLTPTDSAASVHRQIVRLLVPWYRRPAYRLTVWRLRFRNWNWRLSRG